MVVHCLFEQSGTFKKEFQKLGYTAYDYDILDDFGQTDYIIDLFHEIVGGYNGEPSIFDGISKDDLILAFYPCTRFEAKIPLAFRGESVQQKNWTLEKKLEYSMKLHSELHDLYMNLCKMCVICLRKDLRLVIENPYTQPHYLTTYWCIRPTIIDRDRTKNGDYYKKPTQYFFVNCEPYNNLVFEALDYVDIKTIDKAKGNSHDRQVERSMIHPQYASRFIRQYLVPPKDD